ncbi:MAG: undecaprenyl-diphosphatase [Halobacteriovoraceae bacterium]|nr:undecaprenyl-diphosphatase [Halobacteriovoraceae bacterium]|tara:strand:+ start:71583 stop:72398 length:816 start_codon:yes stop_codon:yes gene_type:complete
MEFISAIIYGIIQGLTEFLPVSSSGHLALLPHILEIDDPGVLFDLSMHVGTALSILIYFFKDIKLLFVQSSHLLTDALRGKGIDHKNSWAFNMIISTITTVIFIFILKPLAFQYGRNPFSMVITLSAFGFFMFIADTFKKDTDHLYMNRIQWGKSFWIGLFQALAIFPGVSRSGSTLTVSRQLGLGREEATRFSFLLSLPIIFAGFFYKLPEIFKGDIHFDFVSLFLGIAVSFVVGLLTIHYFLKFIKKIGLLYFSIYRLILALFVYYYLV